MRCLAASDCSPSASRLCRAASSSRVLLVERLPRQRDLLGLRDLVEARLLGVERKLLLQSVREEPKFLGGRELRRFHRVRVLVVVARAQSRGGARAVSGEGLFERLRGGQRVAIGLQALRAEGLRRRARQRRELSVDLAERRGEALQRLLRLADAGDEVGDRGAEADGDVGVGHGFPSQSAPLGNAAFSSAIVGWRAGATRLADDISSAAARSQWAGGLRRHSACSARKRGTVS